MRDIDIRKVLLKSFQQQYKNDKDTLIIPELGLCQGEARVDIAIVNGTIHGYEIKSERDTLNRLSGQQDIYNKVLDRVTVVAGSSHISKIRKTVPKWWGIIEAKYKKDELVLHDVRKSKENVAVDPMSLVQLLWRDEALAILKDRYLHKGLTKKPRHILWETLVEFLSTIELQTEIRQKIRARQYWRSAHLQTLDDD